MPVLANGGADAYQRKQQEKQACDFQPKHVRYPADIAGRDSACVVKGADDAILPGSSARYSQERAALPA